MYNTAIKLGDGINQPVITDDAAGVSGAYASARVHLANFSIDGNKANNPKGKEGIFTTAYYSTFENLYILDCQTHGLRFGFGEMRNAASQNRVTGCRIANCKDAGIYLDINGVDHTVSENYIQGCDYGVVINNGGIRVINNAVFGHTSAGIQVRQTSYDTIIANNDLNANQQHGIHVTRTDKSTSGPWSQILISGNAILGDALEAHNKYDGIYVETVVPDGIAKLTIVGNKVFALNDPKQFRYGINLANNVTKAKCAANHIHNAASGKYHVGFTCSQIEIDSIGGGALDAPTIPRTQKALANPYHVPVTIHIAGGKVTAIAIDGHPTGLTGGSFRLAAGQAIALTYTSAPTWTWFAD
jgi:parallel beta-helix repeat protein